MLNKIIQFSVNNKLVIGMLMLLWIAYGSYELTKLPIDAVPDITNNQVQLITTAPALGAQDIERLITFPLEQATANIPNLTESRSISRFGLSVITLVFDDKTDVYWARQQVSERLQQVELPQGINSTELGPVTTGLGEIYQYVVKAKPGYEGRYTLADLRTTQDWIIRRQLLGTKGVADVSSFGGHLKQYEVAITPSRLKALNITVADVFNALQNNNANTGGAYIEKGPVVMYIRTEGLANSAEDLERIVIKTTHQGMPILVRDVAAVKMGQAIRYGALTQNNYGEVSGGIVMMLKGENSSEVIRNVKVRIAEIQKTLPKGLVIEPFLDRTKMVNNAITTVWHNLLEGALIVVFVLVLFLGNLRAGFIVASVIPLAMLFAIIMMNTFKVSGNLMSLGALDFGLIVDGAVIIVEAVLHHMHTSLPGGKDKLSQQDMDGEVIHASSRMMNAAVFGQIIILIVYLPILSLQGIEGKMFRPMAETVAFAVLGAFILSVTYVPAISALVISKKAFKKATLSDRVMARLELAYSKALQKALGVSRVMVIAAFALFGLAVFMFTQMGGEFIPQLEEGDFAVETRLLLGTNLSTTIASFTKASNALKKSFPEVEKVVSRIGSGEIPTDPMPIEGGDMIIILKPKGEWTSATTFPELADKMADTLDEVVPGVALSFQYPVQMRFNELMTGAKQDVVIKVFGEDLNQLAAYAEQVAAISRTVAGAADHYMERVAGMPQVVVTYNRAEIAKYGLNIADVNHTLNTAFAGAFAGKMYEDEKRFDVVLRMDNEGRKSMESVNNLLIATPHGTQVPLAQLAKIEEVEGPNQIQREAARRRIIVGFNVRGRDVQSIVEELQQKINNKVKLQAGYSITYGGAFENLQQARKRLSIAVPVALVLIFAMLYFAFKSFKQGLLIYTAIPLSTIGGVFALALRGMPFSISAGVGFIALFGVAVLNGIVLISEFKRLQNEEGYTDVLQVILTGTRNRLRPVLMTASVASLGFLPMALSNGAGAEVQRPLATVVIGGLLTATLLTLFVLPALYLLFTKGSKPKTGVIVAALVVGLFINVNSAGAQGYKTVNLEAAINIASTNNYNVQAARLNEQSGAVLQRSSFDIAKTFVSGDYGQYNSQANDYRIGISQSFSFPTVYSNQKKALKESYNATLAQTRLTQREIRSEVTGLYYNLVWMQQRRKLLQYADSIYGLFETKANLRFKTGESNILEKTTAETQRLQISNQLQMLNADIAITLKQFNLLLQDSLSYQPEESMQKIAFGTAGVDTAMVSTLPQVQLYNAQSQAARYRWKTEKARLLPDVLIGYNNQSLTGYQDINGQEVYFNRSKRFQYVNAGIGIPLFFGAQRAKIEAARLEYELSKKRTAYATLSTRVELQTGLGQVNKYAQSLSYYETRANPNATLIIATADKQFTAGEIDYLQWVILVNQAIAIKSEYLEVLNNYNQAVISLQKLTNNQ